MAMRRDQFALNCRIGRVSARLLAIYRADFRRDLRSRLFSSNNRSLTGKRERIEDTYVQVCLSRAIPLTSISMRFACRRRRMSYDGPLKIYRDRDLTNRQFSPSSSAYMRMCVLFYLFFFYIGRRESSRFRRET